MGKKKITEFYFVRVGDWWVTGAPTSSGSGKIYAVYLGDAPEPFIKKYAERTAKTTGGRIYATHEVTL